MALPFLGGCADLGYYLQSARGHLGVMQAARPVDDWIAGPPTPSAALQRQLLLAQRIRRFAVTELALPDNASYTRYADLQRPAVVWNVVAAPRFSLTLHTWCFPVAGCVGYRGYFEEAAAKEMAAQLQAEGLEVSVYGVPAYSTLGWMNWAGGDPLLNTFIHYPQGELARLVFHELAHQVAYAKDDTMFNESFATAVERLGANLWLIRQGTQTARLQQDQTAERRAQFRALTQATRQRLTKIYENFEATALKDAEKLATKNVAMEEFRLQYARLRANWAAADAAAGNAPSGAVAAQNYSGYDAWVARANNATFGAQAAYDELVPQFEALFRQNQSDWPRFYDAVKRLAQLPKEARRAELAKVFLVAGAPQEPSSTKH